MSHQKEAQKDQDETQEETDQVKQVMMLLLLKGKSCELCGEKNEVLLDLYVKDKVLDPKAFSPEQLCQEMTKSNVFCVMCFASKKPSKKKSKAKSKH